MPVQIKSEPPEAFYVNHTRDGPIFGPPIFSGQRDGLPFPPLAPTLGHHVLPPPTIYHDGHMLATGGRAVFPHPNFPFLGNHTLGSGMPMVGNPGPLPSHPVVAPSTVPSNTTPRVHGSANETVVAATSDGQQGSARTNPAQPKSSSQNKKPGPSHSPAQSQPSKESQGAKASGGKPQIDSSSAMGAFGWATVDGTNIPYLLRDSRKYVAVRMVEMKLLSKYPSSYPEELKTRPPLMSHYITPNETKLLNEINIEHCAYEYGKQPFTTQDLIVKLVDFEEFYIIVKRYFPDTTPSANPQSAPSQEKSKKPSTPECNGPSVGGWLQLNNTVVPYVCRKNSKFVPLSVIRYAAGLLTDIPVDGHDPTELECSYFNGSCSSAGLNFQFTRSTKLVSIEVVKEKCPGLMIKELPRDDPFSHASYQPQPEEEIVSQVPETPTTSTTVTSTPASSTPSPVVSSAQHNILSPPAPTFPGQPVIGPHERLPPPAGGYWMNPHLGIFPGMSTQGLPGILPPVGAMGPPGAAAVPSAAMASHNQNLGLPASVIPPSHIPSTPDMFQQMPFKPTKHEGLGKDNGSVSPTIAASHGRRSSSSGTPQTRSPGAQSAGPATPNLPPHSPGVINPHLTAMSAMNSTCVSAGQSMSTPAMQQMMAAAAAVSQARMQGSDAPRMPPMWQAVQNNQAEMFRMLHMMPPAHKPFSSMLSTGLPPGMPPGPNMMALANLAATRPPDLHTAGAKGVFTPGIPASGFVPSMPGNELPRFQVPELLPPVTSTSAVPNTILSPNSAPHTAPAFTPTSSPALISALTSGPNPDLAPVPALAPGLPPALPPLPPLTAAPLKPPPVPSTLKECVPVSSTTSSSATTNSLQTKSCAPSEPAPINPPMDKGRQHLESSPPKSLKSAEESQSTDSAGSSSKQTGSKDSKKSKTKVNGMSGDSVQITPLEFQGKILSCIVKGNEPYALVEAIAKVFFPYCSLVEVGYAMETVLNIPLLTLTLEEEKAFIRFYGLRTETLTCNQAVSLKDFIDFMPQLKYMFKDKEMEHNSKESGKGKASKTGESGGGAASSSPTKESEVPESVDSNSGDKKKDNTFAALRAHLSNKRGLPLPSPPHHAKQPRRLEDTVNRLKLQHVISEIPTTQLTSEVPESPVTSEVPEPPPTSEVPEPPLTSEVPEPPLSSEVPEPPLISEVPEPPQNSVNGDLNSSHNAHLVLNVPQVPSINQHNESDSVERSNDLPDAEEKKPTTFIVNDNNNGEKIVICID